MVVCYIRVSSDTQNWEAQKASISPYNPERIFEEKISGKNMKRPQLQERITKYAADIIMEELNPYGVIVVVEAEHMCMTMRGVKKPGSKTITSAVRGIFEKDIAARAEAMSLITMK